MFLFTFVLDGIYWARAKDGKWHGKEAVAQRCSLKNVFLEISRNSRENTCARVFFNKVAGLRPATLFKKRLWHRCFPVNFAKVLGAQFFTEKLRWLLLGGNQRLSAKWYWHLLCKWEDGKSCLFCKIKL